MKKTYFIDKIQNNDVNIVAESIDDLQMKAAEYCFEHRDNSTKIYVHCSNVCSLTNMEQHVEYIVTVNNQKRTITTRRI